MRLLSIILLILLSNSAFAQSVEEIPTSHGIAIFGKLKYDANFKHFEYANPAAPKGGQLKLAAIGTFDSLNPFIVKGNKSPELVSYLKVLWLARLMNRNQCMGWLQKM
ncbi:MAG: hypothetical protein WCJ33_08660 [Pseudomonadota bacterium]